MLIHRLPLLDKSQRGEHQLPRLAAHDQMQHDRHADQQPRRLTVLV